MYRIRTGDACLIQPGAPSKGLDMMQRNMAFVGSIVGLLGVLTCFVAGAGRLLGYHYILDFQGTTVFNVGVGLMVFACLIRLEELAAPRRQ